MLSKKFTCLHNIGVSMSIVNVEAKSYGKSHERNSNSGTKTRKKQTHVVI